MFFSGRLWNRETEVMSCVHPDPQVVTAPCGFACVVIPPAEYHQNPFRVSGQLGVDIWPFLLVWLLTCRTACTSV